MSRKRLFGSLCLLVFVVNFSRVVFAPLLSEFMAVFGVGAGTVGVVATLAWVGGALSRVPTGWLLTRFSRHRTAVGAGLLLTAAAWFTASVDSIAGVAVGAFSLGVATGVYFISANPFVSELFPERVGRALGIHGSASQAAAVAAAPVVTLVLARAEWRAVFVLLGVAGLLATALVAVGARRTSLPSVGASGHDFYRAVRSEWPRVLFGVVLLGSMGFVWQGVFNFYELYMVQKGLPSATAKNSLVVLFGAGVPAFAVSGRLADRLPHVPYMLSLVAGVSVSLFVLTRTSGTLALLVVGAVLGYVVHSVFPAMDTFLLDALPDETRASAYAVYSGGMMVVQSLGSSAVGVLVETGLQYDAVFGVLAAGLGALVVVLAALHSLDRLPT